ncbi:MAG: leucine-rich repeat domain-containing protein [Bacteroidales bacterium]|nr:leucine-rich repeat domain-containing protein [Bacteroidales bacterium]
MKGKAYIFIVLLMAALTSSAGEIHYSFSAVAPTGQTLYYRITGSRTVAVTYPNQDYSGSSSHVYYDGYTKPTGDLIIPAMVDYEGVTYSVTSIGEKAFTGCNDLTYVDIPYTVSEIEKYGFAVCVRLSAVTLPNSLETIGRNAFAECVHLSSITIPATVSNIETYAFAWCEGMTMAIIGEPLTASTLKEGGTPAPRHISKGGNTNNAVIGDYAFTGCKNLTSVFVGQNFTTLGAHVFDDCDALASITMESPVPPTIGDEVFTSNPEIFIPCNSKRAYRSASSWRIYEPLLKEMCGEVNGISTLRTSTPHITTEGRQIVVNGGNGASISLLDTSGHVLDTRTDSHNTIHFTVPARGIYLIRIDGGATHKVSVTQ